MIVKQSPISYKYEDFRSKLEEVIHRYSEKTAIVCIGENGVERKLTYKQMSVIIQELGDNLKKEGIERAERVAVVAKTTAESVVLNLGLAYLGYTAVLIDAVLPKEERNKLLEYAEVNAVFSTADIYNQMDDNLVCAIPAFELRNDFSSRPFNTSTANIKCKKKCVTPCDEDVIAIIFSSGTTAEMKGVMLTYNSALYAQKYITKYANLNNTNTFLDVLPANHIAGYSSTISCLLTGTEVGFVEDMTAEKLLLGFCKYNPTDFIMIPKVYEAIKNKIEAVIDKKPLLIKWYARMAMKICGSLREKTGINLRVLTKPIWKAALGKKMKLCGCGTLPCDEEVIKFYLDLGIDFLNVYGSTETGFPITAANCNDKYPLKGAGNVKQFEEIKVMIHEPDVTGIGEIRVKTPLIMKGYFKDEELTKQAFDEEGYFKTGDLGYIDSEGNLYIVGRIKETIVLHNGKKVSPNDVDKYYQNIIPDIAIASCGIDFAEGYNKIYLFVERGKHSETKIRKVMEQLKEASAKSSLYMAEKILVIDKIPVTSVGKVKRFLLKKFVEDLDEVVEIQRNERVKEKDINGSIEEKLILLIERYAQGIEVTMETNIKNALEIDSLDMFELYTEIENELGISIINRLDSIEIVRDILKKGNTHECMQKNYSIRNFPQKKKRGDLRYIRHFGRMGRLLYGLEVTGFENIPQNENILLCPNHESYLDAMWVAAALIKNGYNMEGFCCLAAEHLKDKRFMKKAFRALGGIPIDREDKTAVAIQRAKECLEKTKCCMLIHPEGTRTRSGRLGDYKNGAAKLAAETRVKIVPVCINGAYEVFPPNASVPRLFEWKRLRRYTIQIKFGPAINPLDKTETEITQHMREYVVEQKKMWGEK